MFLFEKLISLQRYGRLTAQTEVLRLLANLSCTGVFDISINKNVTTTMNKGEQLTYVLILANANKKGIQRLELTLERK